MQPSMTSNQMGGNPQLAKLFGMQPPAGPQGGGATLPTIQQPVRPQIGMPPAPPPRPVSQGPAQPQINPWSMVNIGGQMKPAAMTSLVQKMGRPSGPPSEAEMKAMYGWLKSSRGGR